MGLQRHDGERTNGSGGDGHLDDLDSAVSTIASLEAQLVSLYAEREELHTTLGVSDAADVIALVDSRLSAEAYTALTDELASLRSERAALLETLGVVDAHAIVDRVRALESKLAAVLSLFDNLNTLLKEPAR
jgi:hypothetical protein